VNDKNKPLHDLMQEHKLTLRQVTCQYAAWTRGVFLPALATTPEERAGHMRDRIASTVDGRRALARRAVRALARGEMCRNRERFAHVVSRCAA